MTKHINWGIIGCGNVTEVKSGPAFNKVPNSSLIAVMRRDAEKAADYAQRHNVPKWYSDAYQLINDPEVDAVYIATPPSSHEEYTLACMAAGKPVYVEKPVALSAQSCQKMHEASKQFDTKLTVAHYRRQLPFFKKVKQLLDEETIGTTRLVTISMLQAPQKNIIAQTEDNWRVNPAISGGGLFHDLAPHQLDLMYHFFGPAKECVGTSANQAGIYNADDFVTGYLQFENKMVISGNWCFAVAEDAVEDKCVVIGDKGIIRFPFFGGSLEVMVDGRVDIFDIPNPQHVEQPMIEEVVKYFLGSTPNPCPAEEAIVVMDWMDQMTAKR